MGLQTYFRSYFHAKFNLSFLYNHLEYAIKQKTNKYDTSGTARSYTGHSSYLSVLRYEKFILVTQLVPGFEMRKSNEYPAEVWRRF